MEEQLFLFEVLIEDIFFEDVSGEIPTKKQLVITVTLGNIVTLEIRSETLPLKGGEGSNKRHIEFKCGKSYLCFFSPDNLLDALESKPIEIVVGIKGDVQPMSSSTCPWHDCFKEMVAESKDIVGFLTPASIADNFTLVNNDARKGNIQMFLRLSCFGKSLQTQYEFNTKSGNREFVFKSPYMMTTFMCTKYGVGDSSDFLPISPMYTITNINADKATPSDQSVSWTAIPKPTHDLSFRSSVQSECMFPEYLTSAPPAKSSTLTFDIVSLCDRPEEDKFIDFNTGRRISDVHDQHEKSTIHSDDLELENNLQRNGIKEELDFGKNICINGQKDNSANALRNTENKINYTSEKNLQIRKDEEGVFQIGFPKSTELSTKKIHLLRLRGGAPTKSAMAECEEVMEQFDKILQEYRNAITPCGQIGCNFAPNLAEAACNRTCFEKLDNGNNTDGCGSPECEYAKYKSGLIPMDADIEKQFIGPAIIGNCGHPKCPYQLEPILPPIHWDCPEPLPIGKCTNPNCPYTSNEMAYRGRFSTTKGPCGSDECPYVPPAPCSSPNCPFRTRPPCATAKEAKEVTKNRGDRRKNKSKEYASCPFSNPPTIINIMQICDNPDCEILKKVDSGDCETRSELCKSPNCPYRNIKKKCLNPKCPFTKSDVYSPCSNPDCPLNQEPSDSCSNPNCPFARSSTEPISESTPLSSNANNSQVCSYLLTTEEGQKEPCVNPDCPFNIASVESCKNPDCPFKDEKLQESNESCDNPECPFKTGSKMSGESQESQCECDNPLCPSKRETCLNPNCPFNLRGYDPCTNPECPHRKYALGKDLGYCSTPSPSFNEMCADKTCPFYEPDKEAEQNDPVALGKSMTKIGHLLIEKGPLEVTGGDRPSVYDAAPCGLKTCKFMGGQLECMDCSVGTEGRRRGPCPKTCPGDPICPLATERKLRRTGKRQQPLFKRTSKGKESSMTCTQVYPGYKIGHRDCVIPYFFVPPKMGWLWNIHTPCLNLKPRRGWRPGAITRTVAKAITKHRKAHNDYPFERNQRKRRKKNNDDSETKLICPKPTLEVKKREGAYFITMNPLKDPKTLEMNENPYMDVTPLQFKVAKNNALDPDCVCTDEGEYYKSDSSSNSEFDIEVTTPAGIIHPDRPPIKKKDVVKQTQYDRRDIPPPEKSQVEKKPKKAKKGKDKKKKK